VAVPFYFIGRCAGNALLMLVACFSITYLFMGGWWLILILFFYALSLIVICKSKFNSKRSPMSSANKVSG